jgi:hypothetical protein
MADELELISINAAGTSWVDNVPQSVEKGYQAQNTNIEARSAGGDASFVQLNSGKTAIEVEVSGFIDDNGLPFATKTKATLTPATPGVGTRSIFWITVIPGSVSTKRSLNLSSTPPVWDATKNAFYSSTGSLRYLNWVIYWGESERYVTRYLPPSSVHPPDRTIEFERNFRSGKYQIPPLYMVNELFKYRVKKAVEVSGSGTTTINDKLCVNPDNGQIILFDDSADLYRIYNPDLVQAASFARSGSITSKPNAIAWSRVGDQLVSFLGGTGGSGRLWYHSNYTSSLTRTVNHSFLGYDLVSYEEPSTGTERWILGYLSGSPQLIFFDVSSGGVVTTQLSTFQLSQTPLSLALNTDLDLLTAHSDGGNTSQEVSVFFFNATEKWNITTTRFLASPNADRIYQLNYNPATGGYVGLYRTTPNNYLYLVQMGA